MNLWAKLRARADRPVRVGLIGADKFGAMFLARTRVAFDSKTCYRFRPVGRAIRDISAQIIWTRAGTLRPIAKFEVKRRD